MREKSREMYEQELLTTWEETYKKGQLTFWIFLALKEEAKYADEIMQFVIQKTQGSLRCEEQSLYRTLRKYRDLEMVDFRLGPGEGGPDRKYYFLTPLGSTLLQQFIGRNIVLFFDPQIQELILKRS